MWLRLVFPHGPDTQKQLAHLLFYIPSEHILQVIKTGWNNFQSIITGVEIIKADKTLTKDAKA